MVRENAMEKRLVFGIAEPLEVFYVAYGDRGFTWDCGICTPCRHSSDMDERRRLFNVLMASVRVSIENAFAKVVNLWAFVDFDKNLHLSARPIGSYSIVAVLLTNAHSRLYVSPISSTRPPHPSRTTSNNAISAL